MLHSSFLLQTSSAAGRGFGRLRQEEEGVVITSCGALPSQGFHLLRAWTAGCLPHSFRVTEYSYSMAPQILLQTGRA